MKKPINTVVLIILSLLMLISAASCGNENGTSIATNEEELEKLPENFPIKNCPLYGLAEIVSIVDKGSADYLSYELTFNSNAEYEQVIEYYEKYFTSPITKDFGIAYSLLSVPNGKGYMCNFNIYSTKTKGENGVCTIIVTVSDY